MRSSQRAAMTSSGSPRSSYARRPARVPLATYQRWFSQLPQDLQDGVTDAWGPPPGSLYVDSGDIVLASLRLGNVVLTIQPPRGFGENPIAIYHDPALAPSHHYLAAYWWLAHEFGAHAVVHLGKHGTLEWLPGKGLGLSASCAPDAVLGDLPLIYPFIVNDPGEGTQAKRRAHATIVDHLVPPMARADSYGDLAKLEQLMDEHATVAALDPAEAAGRTGADLDADPSRAAASRPAHRGPPRRRCVRRLPAARRRLPVRDQGRPDPRRAAHPRPGAGGRGAYQPGARDPARPPGLGRRIRRGSGASRSPRIGGRQGRRDGRGRPVRAGGPKPGRERWNRRLGSGRRRRAEPRP